MSARMTMPSLSEATQDDVATRKAPNIRDLVTDDVSEAPPPASPAARSARGSKGAKPPKASSREGARGVTVFLQEEDWMDLKMVALRDRKTVQDLVSETILAMLKKRK